MKVVVVATVLLSLFVSLSASAAQYFVDSTNPASNDANTGTSESTPWRTLAKAATTLVAGDTVTIIAGSYNERVTPTNSGTIGNPITYQASVTCVPGGGSCVKLRGFTLTNKSHITVKGFELTNTGFSADTNSTFIVNASTGIQILDNYIHDTSGTAVRSQTSAAKTRSLVVRGNTMAFIGVPGTRGEGVSVWADDTLVENNDISHARDFINYFGSRIVFRNNYLHDSNQADAGGQHIDGFQSNCVGSPIQAADFALLEGNRHENNPDGDSHFFLENLVGLCTSRTVIIRYNKVFNIGSGFSFHADSDHHKVYNNTIVNGTVGAPSSGTIVMNFGNGCTTCSILNNVFVNAIANLSPRGMYYLKSAEPTSTGNYNLACGVLGILCPATVTWGAPISTEPNRILNQAPLFVGATDFRLQPGSPAIKTGGPLTTVHANDAGSGTSLVVEDAHFFQPGWSGASADWIAVGTVSNAVQISSINYTTNTITLASPITRSDGQPIWLYKDSTGTTVLFSIAPDRGAFPFPEAGPLPPTNLTITR